MKFFMVQVFYVLSTLGRIHSNTVTSPQIRILDVATKASETRLIRNRVNYENNFHRFTNEPLKSYVIYDEYPVKIFKEWKANSPSSAPENYLDLGRQPNGEFSQEYFLPNGPPRVLPQPKPTLAYRSVYSNVIKVFDDSMNGLDRNRLQSDRFIKPFEGNFWKPQPPIDYNEYPQDMMRRQHFQSFKLPENFPKVFAPNEKFHFPSFDDGIHQPPKFFHPQDGYYDTYTINYNNEKHRDEVEVLPEGIVKHKNQKKPFLCGFIRVNQREFPENGGGPCGRSDDIPLVHPEFPDYSSLPNDKIPVEHRRQHFQIKRIKRSKSNQSYERRQKRNAGFGFGYSGWDSPLSYEGYYGDNYPTRAGYRNSYNSGYYGNRNRNQSYRNRYYSSSRYDDYDDDYQNNDDSNSRGLTGYLTNGGRRYKNRKNNDDEDDEDDDNNDNNRDDDSDEEMERMNSNRRDTNDRRNNDDSRDRRRNNNNNNNNDDDDYRDNRRNNNNNNNNNNRNNRRNNNNNNNNNNNRNNNNNNNNNRRYNDRYDYNNRNRYYSNNNGYGNNGYGSSYGGYGNNDYGSSYGNSYSNNGYGSSYGNGYGSSYGGNGGYGYGGYGNGFGSF